MRRAAVVSRKQRITLMAMRRTSLVLGLAFALLAVAGCGGSSAGADAPVVDGVTELTALDQLREAFEADEGKARLILLLSPT